MEQSEQSGTGVVKAVTDENGSYRGGLSFVRPGGEYTGAVEVSFDANFPHLDPQLDLSAYRSEAAAHVRRELAPGELREFAAALNMAADACEQARQSKAT